MYLIKIYLHVSTTDFAKLNAFTFVWANSFRDSNFPQYLSIMQHWFMQIFLVFCCPRRGEETVYLRKRDFTVYLPNCLIYEPNETEIISQEAVEMFLIFSRNCHEDFAEYDRLFHRPSPKSLSFFQVFILRLVDNFLHFLLFIPIYYFIYFLPDSILSVKYRGGILWK